MKGETEYKKRERERSNSQNWQLIKMGEQSLSVHWFPLTNRDWETLRAEYRPCRRVWGCEHVLVKPWSHAWVPSGLTFLIEQYFS